MGFLSHMFALMFLFAISSAKNDETKARCEELTNFATRAVEELSALKDFSRYKSNFEDTFKMNLTNANQRKEVLCKLAGATNLRELYEALPSGVTTYESLVETHTQMVAQLTERVGGYSNLMRLQKLRADMWEWSLKMKGGRTLPEVTDLPTLTHFLQVMQVKFGSRWMALVLHIKHLDFLIEDPVEFAQKLFADGTEEAVEAYTGLNSYQAEMLVDMLKGKYGFIFKTIGFEHLYAEGVELVGDLGFFNLKEE